MVKSRVEECWNDLQARSGTSSKSAAAVLRALNAQTITTASTKRHTCDPVASGSAGISHDQPAQCHSPANVTALAKADFKTRCRPLVQRLVDVSLSVRLSALTDLQLKAVLNDGSAIDEETSDAVSSWLGKALIKCFADESERVRAKALKTFHDQVSRHSDTLLPMLPYVMPILEERLVKAEGCDRPENSEEVRLLLIDTLHVFISGSGSALGAYVAEALNMIRPSLEDPFHSVNLKACACVELLALQLGKRLQPACKELTAQVMGLLTHRRKAVRCAAIDATRRLMFCGAHELLLDMVAWRDPNTVAIKAFYEPETKVNFCGKLSMDESPAVRLSFVDALGDWLLHLDERIDHQGRLLPYLVSALTDSHAPIRQRALQHIDDIGALYEKDNEKDLKDIICYLPSEAHNIGWTPIADVWKSFRQVPLSSDSTHASEVKCKAQESLSCSALFPEVFRERPRLGARRVVAANFPQIVPGIIGELRGWQAHTSCYAMKLLQAYTVYVEDWMQQHLHELLPALLQAVGRSCMETNREAVEVATGCCRMIGVFVTGEVLWETLEPVLTDSLLENTFRQAAAITLRAYAEGATYRGNSDECLGWALEVLVKGCVADTQGKGLKQALVGMLKACVLGASTEHLSAHSTAVVNAMLRLQAWPAMKDAETVRENWQELEEMLEHVASRVVGPDSSVQQLLEQCSEEVVRMWGGSAVQVDVLSAAMQRMNVKSSGG